MTAGAMIDEGTVEPPLRVLLVAYAFPPTGGVGAVRMMKLARYLGEHDVSPSVLTVRNPSVPLHDPARLEELPPGLPILRAPTLEPGYAAKRAVWRGASGRAPALRRWPAALARQLLLPDPQVLWLPGAAAVLARRLAARMDDAVLISGPPFSPFLLALLARLRPGLAVVIDYRDEWSTVRENYEMMGRVAAVSGALLERLLVGRVHAITCATDSFRDNLLTRFPFLDPAHVHAVPNGYDRSDLPPVLPAAPAGPPLVLTYAGTVFQQNSPRGLLNALRLLHEREPSVAAEVRVRFIGRIVETEEPLFAGSERWGVERVGFLPQREVLHELCRSHLALCLLDDLPWTRSVLPAKIFELMLIERPLLTLAPEGELSALVRRHRLGEVLPPRNEQLIAARLEGMVRELRLGRAPAAPRPMGIERYERRSLAGEFAGVLRGAVARAGGHPVRPPAAGGGGNVKSR